MDSVPLREPTWLCLPLGLRNVSQRGMDPYNVPYRVLHTAIL